MQNTYAACLLIPITEGEHNPSHRRACLSAVNMATILVLINEKPQGTPKRAVNTDTRVGGRRGKVQEERRNATWSRPSHLEPVSSHLIFSTLLDQWF